MNYARFHDLFVERASRRRYKIHQRLTDLGEKSGKFGLSKGLWSMAETLFKDEVIVRDIIDTARGLFKKSGFKKTTMGDIAHSLGKAKSSLYYYYPSKEDIFEAVLHAEMDELLAQILQSIRHAGTSKEKLTIYCRCRLVKLNELCNLSDALKSDIGELHELHCIMTDLKRQFDTTHVELVREILAEGVANGEFK
jgi:AcrR family transcriptional regulator